MTLHRPLGIELSRVRSLGVSVFALAVPLLGPAREVGAQSDTGATCAALTTPRDSIDAPVLLELTIPSTAGIPDRKVALARKEATLLLLQEVRSAFVAPPALGLAVNRSTVMAAPANGNGDVVPELAPRVTFRLLPDGHVRDVRVAAASPAAALDSALVNALLQAARQGGLAGLSTPLGTDSLAAEIATTVGRGGLEPNLPLMRVRLPRFAIPRLVVLPPLPSPEYPWSARRAGIKDRVTIRFVIDTLGRIDVESLSVLAATYREFVESVFAVVPRIRFEPTRIGDCAVAIRSSMPFDFSLTPR